jgi:hypothetical protein
MVYALAIEDPASQLVHTMQNLLRSWTSHTWDVERTVSLVQGHGNAQRYISVCSNNFLHKNPKRIPLVEVGKVDRRIYPSCPNR